MKKIPVLSKKDLLVIAFVEGACVMAVELIGAKMIAPFFGTSLYVWSSVLAITLIALTTGYYTGGIFSEKYSGSVNLLKILGGTTICILLMPFISHWIMKFTLDMGFKLGSIISSLVFLFPSLCLMGMVSPYIIKLISETGSQAGKSAGLVYAVSTTGGVLSTLITGFVFIPEFGIRMSAIIFSLIMGGLVMFYFFQIKKMSSFLILLSGLLVLSMANIKAVSKMTPSNPYYKLIHRSDGLHGQLVVVDDIQTTTRSLYVNSISQSYMHVPTKRSQWPYIHRLSLYSSFKKPGSRVLIAGLGAGNLVSEFLRSGFNIDVVEIDSRMEHIARKYFFMEGKPNIYINDARSYIRSCKKKYDIVILDMSLGENQPSHVYTIEGFREIFNLLPHDGMLFLHYQNKLTDEGLNGILALGRTLKEAGFYVKMINTNPKAEISEQIYIATKGEFDLAGQDYSRRDPFAVPFNFPTEKNVYLNDFDFGKGIILTDDKPMMEEFHQNVITFYRQSAIEGTLGHFLSQNIKMY